MMFNIGIDIEQVSRFRNKNDNLLKKILSKNELKNIRSYNAQHIAGIFSAKEAVIKVCSPIKKIHFENIEVLRNKDGSPYVALRKCNNINSKCLKISISHSKDYVVSTAILFINKKAGKN